MKAFKQFVVEEADKKDTVTFDIPLLIRVLELAREDIKSDMDLHRVVERLIDMRSKGTLTMDDYDFIAHIKESVMDEHIVKSGSQYKLVSKKTGKNLGTYPSIAGAKKREREVQYFKHMSECDGGSAGPTNVVGGGAIAGTGVKGGEPGVNLKKKKLPSPVMIGMTSRKPPKIG